LHVADRGSEDRGISFLRWAGTCRPALLLHPLRSGLSAPRRGRL